eukprot:CAMPEP_0183497746 /NCGR_PEP_ID=MMETSP0371-20130417/174_1 /TAXON_ID=268820 /ORGANISM="Peridinium aciculiferum, Strain PAER-2" /LENGTH=101 /DNA_ID=CAMNT_0025691125 /DNA_START=69 /DNA_END=371 /DNA_ORIENTATION=-
MRTCHMHCKSAAHAMSSALQNQEKGGADVAKSCRLNSVSKQSATPWPTIKPESQKPNTSWPDLSAPPSNSGHPARLAPRSAGVDTFVAELLLDAHELVVLR